MSRRSLVIPVALVGVLLSAPGAVATAPNPHAPVLVSRTPGGAQPNAPATDPVLSMDGRLTRYAAYVSAATDIVAGSGSHRNVFLVRRARPWPRTAGIPWKPGKTVLVSSGRGGKPANGDSWSPSFSGYDYGPTGRETIVGPRCLGFVSAASNLVAGDRDHHADVFIEHLPSGRLTRIAGAGAASEVALDGRCWYAAYVAGGTVYLADLRHGGAKRISGFGGASAPELSANGKITTYSRRGVVYVNRQGQGGTHRIGAGTEPSSDGWGKLVVYVHDGAIWEAKTQGAPHAHRYAAGGTSPSITGGGWFPTFITADGRVDLYLSGSACPDGGTAQQLDTSWHDNYGIFSCSTGAAYISWVTGGAA